MEAITSSARTNQRMTSIDLFKALSMLMVVFLHLNYFGGILYHTAPSSALRLLSVSIEAVCIVAVNCFALATGYLCAERKIRIKNIVQLYLQVLFYSILFFSVFCIVGDEEFSLRGLLLYLTPATSGIYWYFTSYFILFFFMPLLNAVIKNVNLRVLLPSLLALTVIFTVLEFFSSAFGLKGGYTAIWLIYLYLIGGTVKKYGDKIRIRGNKIPCILYLAAFFVCVILNVLTGLLRRDDCYALPMVFDYNFIFNFLGALMLLLFFANLPMRESKFISFLSKTSFGVYLIHEHPYVRGHVIQGSLSRLLTVNPILAFLGIVGAAVAVYAICTAIEYLRQLLFSLLKINKIPPVVEEKTLYLLDRMSKK